MHLVRILRERTVDLLLFRMLTAIRTINRLLLRLYLSESVAEAVAATPENNVFRAFAAAYRLRWRYWSLTILLGYYASVAAGTLLAIEIIGVGSLGVFIARVINSPPALLVFVFVITRRSVQSVLMRRLVYGDCRRCGLCGYLRLSAEAQCPECGIDPSLPAASALATGYEPSSLGEESVDECVQTLALASGRIWLQRNKLLVILIMTIIVVIMFVFALQYSGHRGFVIMAATCLVAVPIVVEWLVRRRLSRLLLEYNAGLPGSQASRPCPGMVTRTGESSKPVSSGEDIEL